MQVQLEFYEEIERQFDDTRQRLQGLKQELSAYEKIMSLLNDHINENRNVQKRLATNNEDERKQTIVKESYEKLWSKYDRFRVSKMDREDEYKRLMAQKNNLENTLNSMKTQIVSIKKLQEEQENRSENIRPADKQNSDPAFDYDVETINFLNEGNWYFGQSCDRDLSERFLRAFPNGTFLVRSSKTQQNSYVLSVVTDSKVRHCLIDKIGEEYCFHPPGPTHQLYSSLCNLVMDYRHKSLVCHNPELDTNLIYPILSQIYKTKSGCSSCANGDGGQVFFYSTSVEVLLYKIIG